MYTMITLKLHIYIYMHIKWPGRIHNKVLISLSVIILH